MELGRSVRIQAPGLLCRDDVQEEPEELQVLPRHAAHKEDRGDPCIARHALCTGKNILLALDNHWHLAYSRRLHNLGELVDSSLQNIVRTHVNLGDNKICWTFQRKGNSKVLFGHSLDSHVRSNHHHRVIGNAARHPIDSCLDVSLVAGEIDEGDNLGALLHNLAACLGVYAAVVNNVSTRVYAHDVLRNAGRPPAFQFMPMPKDRTPSKSSAVIKLPRRQHTHYRALSAIDIADHSYSHVDEVPIQRLLPNHHLRTPALLALLFAHHCHVTPCSFRHLLESFQRGHKVLFGDPFARTVVFNPNGIDRFS
mmetsp:Transcript_7946/g.18119  ORF Transcript_7946/g.18119 Transcript_7946/m.18119 type:complete len:310 (+) Transcript_7946:705-1634(+)